MQTAQHFILNQLEETSLRATTWSSKIVRWEEFVHIFHLLHILEVFRWFMHEGCCHELEVEEVVCSTCEAMEGVKVEVA